ncbi:hypothetical protein BH09PSE6_BH09PSE6_22660 [soil metagenome]
MNALARSPLKRIVLTAMVAVPLVLSGCSGIPVSGAAGPRAPAGDPTAPPAPTGTPTAQLDGSGEGTPAAPPIATRQAAALDTLLINTRDLLLLAPDVARIRWNAKQTDLGTEGDQRIADEAVAQAAQYKADPTLFRDYLQAQSAASRYVQNALFKQWRDAGVGQLTLTRTPAQVQAASDSLSPQLLASLAAAAPVLKTPGIRPLIESRAQELLPTRSALSDPTRALAIRPLLDRAAR